MLVQIDPEYTVAHVRASLQSMGLNTTVLRGQKDTQACIWIGQPSRNVSVDELLCCPGVTSVKTTASSHPRVDRQGPVVAVGDVYIGGHAPVLMAGPCSVESEAQIHRAAATVARAGATFLRGGVFKPRTSPYSFQGLGLQGLTWLREAASAHNLKVVTEVMGVDHLDAVAQEADLLQIGSRNMQNYALLHAIGETQMPVLLKRAASATLNEWLLAAEHVLHAGGTGVVFCERGVRGFDKETRYVLDIASVALLRDVYNVPVIVDPSHATGRRDLVQRLGLASLVAGASGLLVESHPDPGAALSDGPQQLTDGEIIALGTSMGLAQVAHGAQSLSRH